MDDEARALRDRERRIADAQRHAEREAEREREAEEAREQRDREAAATRQGILAIVGAAAIGKATSGGNYTAAQRSTLVDSYVKDRVNAIDGVQSNNFARQTEAVKRELDEAGRVRAAAASEARRQQAEQVRVAIAERRATEARLAAPQAERTATANTKPVAVAAASPELAKTQAQVVALPSWPQTCPPGSMPMRHPNGTPVTVAPGAVCVKDPNATTASAQGTNMAAGKNGGTALGTNSGPAHAGAADTPPTASATTGGTPTKTAGTTPSQGGVVKEEAPKKPEKKLFRKTPAQPPSGSAAEGLTKANGEYKCDAVNAYAKPHEKEAQKLSEARYKADYRSELRCQARCDLLAWREEIISTFKYRGSWSCSVPAVGLWNAVDAAADYRGYRDGNNNDYCTCVTSSDVPITFTP